MSSADILVTGDLTAGASCAAGGAGCGAGAGAGGGAPVGVTGGAAQPAIIAISIAGMMNAAGALPRVARRRASETPAVIRSARRRLDSTRSSNRGNHAPGDLSRLELVQGTADFRQRPFFYRYRLDLPRSRQRDHFFQFGHGADTGSLDPPRALHHQYQRYRDFSAVKPDHDQLSTLAQRRQREARGVRRTDQIHRAVQRPAGDLLEFLSSIRIAGI